MISQYLRCFLITKAAFSIVKYPLKNSFILDLGTTIYIFNKKSRFNKYKKASPSDYIWASNSPVPILGYRDIDIKIQRPELY